MKRFVVTLVKRQQVNLPQPVNRFLKKDPSGGSQWIGIHYKCLQNYCYVYNRFDSFRIENIFSRIAGWHLSTMVTCGKFSINHLWIFPAYSGPSLLSVSRWKLLSWYCDPLYEIQGYYILQKNVFARTISRKNCSLSARTKVEENVGEADFHCLAIRSAGNVFACAFILWVIKFHGCLAVQKAEEGEADFYCLAIRKAGNLFACVFIWWDKGLNPLHFIHKWRFSPWRCRHGWRS